MMITMLINEGNNNIAFDTFLYECTNIIKFIFNIYKKNEYSH
jgi:hypothetical protein